MAHRRNYRRSTRTRSRGHTGYGRGSAVLAVLVFALLCGGIVATTPIPDGVGGFAFAVITLGIVLGGGTHRSRHR